MKSIASLGLVSAIALLSFAQFDVRFTWADTFGSGANTFNIDFVNIGNPGNLADTTGDPNPAGSVPYVYRIGKFEISEQMIHKANTLGGLGIIQLIQGPDKPADPSWNDAARFINWLDTSTGSPPAYKFATQPGEVGYDANVNIELWTPSDAGYDPNNLYRNSLARYFLPSDEEWYKAAYYDPTSGVYYEYPTGSNTAPTAVASGTASGTAVYNQYNQVSTTGPADITLAGGLSPYGTMGQGGNGWERQETESDLVNNSVSSLRGVRGGDWFTDSGGLSSSNWNGTLPSLYGDGFRVASIPEPSTLLLAALALVPFAWRTRADRNRLRRFAKKFRSAGLLIALVVISSDNLANCSFAAIIRVQDNSIIANRTAPQDGFNITRDTITGLDWLDLTLTTNRSFADVTSQFGAGGDYAGFRVAADVEIGNLYLDVGAPVAECDGPQCAAAADFMISAFGYNQTFSVGPAGSGFRNPNHNARAGYRSVSQYADFNNGSIAFVGINSGELPDIAAADNGTWLVRNIAVPEPTSLLLSVVAVVGMAMLRHRL